MIRQEPASYQPTRVTCLSLSLSLVTSGLIPSCGVHRLGRNCRLDKCRGGSPESEQTSVSPAEQLTFRQASCRPLVSSDDVCDCMSHCTPQLSRRTEAKPLGSSSVFSSCRWYVLSLDTTGCTGCRRGGGDFGNLVQKLQRFQVSNGAVSGILSQVRLRFEESSHIHSNSSL